MRRSMTSRYSSPFFLYFSPSNVSPLHLQCRVTLKCKAFLVLLVNDRGPTLYCFCCCARFFLLEYNCVVFFVLFRVFC